MGCLLLSFAFSSAQSVPPNQLMRDARCVIADREAIACHESRITHNSFKVFCVAPAVADVVLFPDDGLAATDHGSQDEAALAVVLFPDDAPGEPDHGSRNAAVLVAEDSLRRHANLCACFLVPSGAPLLANWNRSHDSFRRPSRRCHLHYSAMSGTARVVAVKDHLHRIQWTASPCERLRVRNDLSARVRLLRVPCLGAIRAVFLAKPQSASQRRRPGCGLQLAVRSRLLEESRSGVLSCGRSRRVLARLQLEPA